MPRQKYNDNVFINCPFDITYKLLFDAIVFGVYDCGFVARCALEEDDGSQIRVQKIFEIISKCRLALHDLSRIELDTDTKLPRFNMPLELGVFLGAKHYGNNQQKRKVCLILDSEKYRYQKFISDIAGQDIQAHENDPKAAIRIVRNWLRSYSQTSIPSGSVIWNRYQTFRADLPQLCAELKLDINELIYNDYTLLVSKWLKINT
jgi:hypothetical protein